MYIRSVQTPDSRPGKVKCKSIQDKHSNLMEVYFYTRLEASEWKRASTRGRSMAPPRRRVCNDDVLAYQIGVVRLILFF